METRCSCLTAVLAGACFVLLAGCGKSNPPDGGVPDAGPGRSDGGPDGGPSDDGGTTVVGPAVDPTVPSFFPDVIRFIYEGNDPVQTGVTPGAIDERRVIVLRGHVRTRAGLPVKDALVSIVGGTEFGSTHTREDGWFDLAANGGGVVKVNIAAPGYLSVQRQAMTSWRRWVVLDEAVLTPLDPKVTTISPGASTFQVHTGTAMTDADGTRQQVLLFQPGTSALAVLPDGGTQTLPSLHVRTTEYTVGPDGPAAMPAPLPPTSGYTYAAELSVDEAEALGATGVRFSAPVIGYLENFLSMPPGDIVPVGIYDRAVGQWKGGPDGVVLNLLPTTGSQAEIDLDGDGIAETGEVLASIGINAAERATLLALYGSGAKSLWRFTTTHFSPVDCNFPYGPPPDATPPPNVPPVSDDRPDPEPDCDDSGSIVECENQTLGESLPISGTPFALVYRSDQSTPDLGGTKIVLTQNSFPASLFRVDVEVTGAGRRILESFDPAPNLNYYFKWDGNDAYGRSLPGLQPFEVKVTYLYEAIFGRVARVLQNSGPGGDGGTGSGSFGSLAEGPAYVRGRIFYLITRTYSFTTGRYVAPVLEMGHWTLNIHHRYQPDTNTLFRGDGDRSQPLELRSGAELMLGGGSKPPAEGLAGTDVNLTPTSPMQIIPKFTAGPDGTIYITITSRFTLDNYPVTQIWGLTPDRKLKLIAGINDPSVVLLRDMIARDTDDIPATETTLQSVQSITVAPDGNLYVVQYGFKDQSTIIRRIGKDGVIRRFAGKRGVVPGDSGDLGPATDAILGDPGLGLGTDAWGNVFIPDNNRVRRVDASGEISTYAFNGVATTQNIGRFTAEGQPARAVSMSHPATVKVASDGALYVSAALDQIVRVGNDGIARTVGGNLAVPNIAGTACDRSRGSCIVQMLDIAPAQDITFTTNYGPLPTVRRLDPGGDVSAITSQNSSPNCFPVAGTAAATCATSEFMFGIGHLPNGELLLGVDWRSVLKISARPLENAIPSSDGTEIFTFDSSGRHLKTLYAQTLSTKYEFQYDARGLLSAVIDGAGNKTTFDRDGQGSLQSITSPYGTRTQLSFDGHGNLQQVKDPVGNSIGLLVSEAGLLTQWTDARNLVHRFTYDAQGRLLKDENAAGGSIELVREDGAGKNFKVTRKTALGRATTFDLAFVGSTRRRVITDPAGLVSSTSWDVDGSVTESGPDGRLTTTLRGPDARFGLNSPNIGTRTIRTPGGLVRTETTTSSVTNAPAPTGPFDFASTVEASAQNGKVMTSTFVAATRELTIRTPLGRESKTVLDAQERPVQQLTSGLLPVTYQYDGRGRVASITQGSRSWTYGYDDSTGYLASLVDSLGRRYSFTRDANGRLLETTLPGSRTVRFTFDPSGNMTSLVVPGGGLHQFAFGNDDRVSVYTPPSAGSTVDSYQYDYDLDGHLVNAAGPDPSAMLFTRDTGGRLGTVMTDQRSLQMVYSVTGGQLERIVDSLAAAPSPSGATLDFRYDGPLITGVSWSGAISGSLSLSYNQDFLVASSSVPGTPSVTNTYDDDLLLRSVAFGTSGALTLERSAQNGLLQKTTMGQVTTTLTHDGYGAPVSMSATSSSGPLLSWTLQMDDAGRVQRKDETVGATSHSYVYSYDVSGRLSDVTIDGTSAGHWTYDPNGNRIRGPASGAGPDLVGVYDARDRLLQYGTTSYVYSRGGYLTSKTRAGQTTLYTYDVFGSLSSVVLPSGDRVDYVLDGLGRRVGKRVNGSLRRGWLYEGLRPVAELDASGTVVTRFAYGTRSTVPDQMWKGGVVYRILTDERGSPRLVVNAATGAVAQRLDFDAWGNVLSDTAPGFQPFGFSGGLYDADTGLTRFGARDYDSELGRWTNWDPARFRGGETNLFLYAAGDPINLVDPTGHAAAAMGDQDPCGDLQEQIRDDRNVLAERAQELIEDSRNLQFENWINPDPEFGSVVGHQTAFRQWQSRARKALNDWNKNNCKGDLPPDAWDLATREAPQPRWKRRDQFLKTLGAAGAGAGAAYGTYRVCRLLPSLLPPLWWTLPVNVVTP